MQDCKPFSTAIFLTALGGVFSTQANDENIEHVDIYGRSLTTQTGNVIASAESLSADPKDSFKRLPGAAGISNGPLTTIAQYRGLFGDRVHQSINGAPITSAGPNAMDPPLSHVFPLPGTRIKLYRGIAPVSVGTQTLGGAIQVQHSTSELFTSQPYWLARFTAQLQSPGNAKHLSGVLAYHSTPFYLQAFSAHHERNDVDSGNGNTIPNSFYQRDMAGLTAGARYGDHQWHGYFQRMDTDNSGTPALAMDINFIDSEMYRLRYQWQSSQLGSVTLRAHGNSNQHDMSNVEYRLTMPMMARLNSVDSHARGYAATWEQHLNNHELEAGLNWHKAKHGSMITNPVLNNLTIHNFNSVHKIMRSAYAQWGTELLSVDVLLGARYSNIDADSNEVASSMAMMNPNINTLVEQFNGAPRARDFSFFDLSLHLSQALTEHVQWQFSVGQKNRVPSYTELYTWLPLGISAGLADGRNYLGNLALKEESARQLDVGITYQSDHMTLSPRLFYQRIDDFIIGSPSTNPVANMISMMMSGQPPLQWDNADATLYGMDLQFSSLLNDRFSLEMIASVVRAERDDINQPLYRIAPASLTTRLQWQHENWGVMLESELVANQSRVSLLQDEAQSAGYGIINANLQYRVSDHLRLTAIFNNLLDKAYQPHLGGVNRVTGITQPVGERLFAPGRTLGVTMELLF